MACAGERGEVAFKGAHFRAIDELAMRQHARHRVVDRAAETAALCRDIDERNRPVIKASMLIHDRTCLPLTRCRRKFWISRRRGADLCGAAAATGFRALRDSG